MVEDTYRSGAVRTVTSVGPQRALQQLQVNVAEPGSRETWIEQARVQALIGSCPRSLPSVLSGMRCWFAFAQRVLKLQGQELPPPLQGLLAWSTLFRHEGTFANYLAHVRLACQLVGASTAVFSDAALKRAKVAIAKRQGFRRVTLRRFVGRHNF